MAERTYMDVRSRIATCLLLNKLDKNKKYSQKITVQDSSHYETSVHHDTNSIVKRSEAIKNSWHS